MVDIGDGVVCLEFHTKMNAIEQDLTKMIYESCDIVEKDFVGMVVANHATNFSVGANILFVLDAAQKKQWDLIAQGVEQLQNANMRMKYLSKPAVVARRVWLWAAAVKWLFTALNVSPMAKHTWVW